ncbi:MAG: DNA topoisomerase I, partial [Candidatus Aenigmatarchaeota archaeon]
MGYTLIIAEKPDAARRIAEALADKKPKVIRRNEVEFYEFTVNGKKHVCVPAVGHLFVLSPPKTNKGWSYPIFSYEWVPTYTKKGTEWTRKYFENIKDLVEGADEFIDAADVDTEGEVLLYNILRFICGVKDAKRIQFSTLTKDELVEAYRNMSSHILFPMLESGLTRHELDWLWGINLTRALTLALKSQAEKGFAILSAGRVQSPTLNLLLERELEIRKFKPKPFWQLELKGKVDNQEIIAMHEKDKFWKKEEVDKVLKNCEGKDAVVKDVKKREYKQKPPFPFNTTDLQAEAYSQFKFSPTQTLQIAESLYQMGAISYPRSSSQKIPSRIGYEKLLKALATLRLYEKFTNELLKKEKLIPHEGPREDPAHYAVIATWEPPDLSKLTPQQRKLYDLIVRRTLATFAEEALRESISAILAIDDNKFIASGKRTIKPGWTEIYSPYLAFEEQILPEFKVGQSVKVIKINLLSKQTQPPPRYTQGSIIKEMEKRNLGTRCITGDTKIPVLINHKMREVEIEKLFDENNSLNGGNEKILINSSNMCFCINDYNLTTSKFTLISRRKLEKDEKVFEITFEDGSKIKLTEEHPVLVYDKSNFVYVPTKNFSKEVTVCSSFHYEKFGKRINFKDFVKKLDSKSKIYGHIELKKWRNCKKITQKNFGKRMGVRQSTIANWEKKKLLPLWVWSKIDLPEPKVIYSVNKKIALKNPFPLTVSSSLIRIVSHLIGDDSLDRKKLKKENCFDFRYTNKNLDLVKLFVKDLEKNFKINKEFKIKTDKKDKNKFYVQIPAVIGRTLGILFKGLISKKVNIDKNFYPDFIGAIFDDEGHAY